MISKLFLDYKVLNIDIGHLFFYVLCEQDATGYHPVGYFSKFKDDDEKKDDDENKDNDKYNLSCILVMPFC